MNKAKIEGNLAVKEKKVIVIEAANHREEDKLRVAAYIRVSSDSADQLNSFMAQANYYESKINSNDKWKLIDVYADEGISGTSVKKRPDFQRMLSDCRRGKIDRIMVKSISRFARNTKECLEIIRELRSLGIGVLFEEQGIDTSEMNGELLTSIFAAIAQKESESISGNMRWSYQYRMQSGRFITCKAPFGYLLNGKSLQIHAGEAEIVREIFQRYLSGESQERIAQWVTTLGIPTRDGNPHWQRTSITYILRNEKYIGNSLLQKRYTTDTLPFIKKRNYGAKDQYFLEESHAAIISREVFEKTQQLLNQRAAKVVTEKREENPLAKKVICAKCGDTCKRIMSSGKVYWTCRTHHGDKHSCETRPVLESVIHEAFLRMFYKLKMQREILEQLHDNLQQIRERKMLWSTNVIELNKRISDLSDQSRMLAEMNQAGLVDSDLFISQNNELVGLLQKVKQEKARIIEDSNDNSIEESMLFLDILDSMPDYLHEFDADAFEALVANISIDDVQICFHLKNNLKLTETIERR